ncbi:MAG: ROK family protein [Anaerolineae bacterium]|nr:ROK family protein [Thermoflexales bacterium]MDW8406989.1 ROK family protein [Anaerolineae bacterium]
METILAFDIGGTKTAVLEGGYDAVVYQRRELPTEAQDPFPVTFARLCAQADEVLAAAQAAGRAVNAISVSIGGPLQIEPGIILAPPHLPTWDNVPLKSLLAERYSLPTYVEHDGNAGALAEHRFGAGRGAHTLIFLTAGTGFGGGMIIGGRLHRGVTDTAGEVGHIRLADYGPKEFGKVGSWEAFCSGAGMVKWAHWQMPGRWPLSLTTRELVSAALAGEPDARRIVRECGRWLGRGLATLIDTLNPEVIVLGSLAVALGDLLLEPAREVVHRECLPQAARACRIVPAQLGARLGDVAALMAAIVAVRGDEIDRPSLRNNALRCALQDSVNTLGRLDRIAEVIEQTASVICDALLTGRKVIVFGNGGSAAQAQHLAGELVGKYGPVRRSLPCIALTADSSVVTCTANDFGYEELFARQVEAFVQAGDVVVGITTGGKSINVLRALETAHRLGARTIALTGAQGLIGGHAEHVVAVPSSSTARIQEAHAFIIHYWCDCVEERVGAEK